MPTRRLIARRNPASNKTLKQLQASQNRAYGRHVISSDRAMDVTEEIERKRREWHKQQRARKNPSKADAVRVSQKVAATRAAQGYSHRAMSLGAEASRLADIEAHRLATVANRPVVVATPEPVVAKKKTRAKKNPTIRQARTRRSGGGFTSLDRAMKAAQQYANETGEIIEVLHDDGRLYSRVHPSGRYRVNSAAYLPGVGGQNYYDQPEFRDRRRAAEVAGTYNKRFHTDSYTAKRNPKKRKTARKNPAGSNWVIEGIGRKAGELWYWTGEKFSKLKMHAKRYTSYEGARERMTLILPFLPHALKAIRMVK